MDQNGYTYRKKKPAWGQIFNLRMVVTRRPLENALTSFFSFVTIVFLIETILITLRLKWFPYYLMVSNLWDSIYRLSTLCAIIFIRTTVFTNRTN